MSPCGISLLTAQKSESEEGIPDSREVIIGKKAKQSECKDTLLSPDSLTKDFKVKLSNFKTHYSRPEGVHYKIDDIELKLLHETAMKRLREVLLPACVLHSAFGEEKQKQREKEKR